MAGQAQGVSPRKNDDEWGLAAPSITLPKGGGAIRDIGEKFAVSAITGAGSLTVPIATSPGRGGFGPDLAIVYDSGSGNGTFGLGWSLPLPSITRKTEKGLPRYRDVEESDVFILSGAEDLVPSLLGPAGQREPARTDRINSIEYTITAYRPRIEGLFARIERWASIDGGDTFWRSISRDNVVTYYGKTLDSRIFDPDNQRRVFRWLVCETQDGKGNAIVYDYQRENRASVDTAQAHERNRHLAAAGEFSNTYLKRIRYANTPSTLLQADLEQLTWHLEVVFDYGEGHYTESTADADGRIFVTQATDVAPATAWPVRADPFSTYRSGFEVRTYRLCRRVLMFHRFDAFGVAPRLVHATEFNYEPGAGLTTLQSITQSGYAPFASKGLLKKSLPPLALTYSPLPSGEDLASWPILTATPGAVENLPAGLDEPVYRWIDLEGEGIPGVLAGQAEAWYYKRNLGGGQLAPIEAVALRPTVGGTGSRHLMDLTATGRLDVVVADSQLGIAGFSERTIDESWAPFRTLAAVPNISWQDPGVQFLDLTGDGLTDLIVSEQEAFVLYRSLGVHGFAPAERVFNALDEEQGPRLLFSDAGLTIFLADMSGDGLTDIVRIRNGDVVYWPNLGYGRFGPKVTMDRSPLFDRPERFDPRRIRLADLDGSGVTDIVYLHPLQPVIYFNQSGNSWSDEKTLPQFPRVDNLSKVQVVDLLGTGTACLVWSSPLPGDATAPLRYIDLMGSTKPHLLTRIDNNLGATTTLQYASSSQFYLSDRAGGRPWITRLPFPVHVVTRVTLRDRWRGTSFSSTYSYHHGYFDPEREFRGFGRVEQIDVEDYGTFAALNANSPYVTQDHKLYQPPVKTVTWTHLGAAFDGRRILSAFAAEYFPARFGFQGAFREKTLPEPQLPANLDDAGWREAIRSCKGMPLRRETYELDVKELLAGRPRPVRMLTASQYHYEITQVQLRGENRHSVFLVTQSELLDYHYELPLPPEGSAITPDPRISHTLVLRHDEYGNVQQSIVIGYGRVQPGHFAGLPRADLIAAVQAESHVVYAETRRTADCVLLTDPNRADSPVAQYRLRLPCEVLTYELTALAAPAARYFEIADLRRYSLNEDGTYPPVVPPGQQAIALTALAYHQQSQGGGPHRRIVGHSKTLYFDDASNNVAPTNALPFGQHGPRGIRYEAYRLALTDGLLDAIFQKRNAAGQSTSALLDWIQDPSSNPVRSVRQLLSLTATSGYVPGQELDPKLAGEYWIRSGVAGFAGDAPAHYFIPRGYTDAFGNVTAVTYDRFDLMISAATDAMGNRTSVATFDYRVLQPVELIDANANHSEVLFDVLGFVVATAIKGKQINGAWQGDHLDDLSDELTEPHAADVASFCASATLNGDQARRWLASATTRVLYDFGERRDMNGQVVAWADRTASACAISRELHANLMAAAAALDPAHNPIQVVLQSSDGSGRMLMQKVQAELDVDLAPAKQKPRWIINGATIVNNKGNLVKQYEPGFSERFGAEMPAANSVSTVTFYDAVSRPVRVEYPDGTYTRVILSPWSTESWDRNDTIADSAWYASRNQLDLSRGLPRDVTGRVTADPEQRAGWLTAQHAGTPTVTMLDSLGRAVIVVANNRVRDTAGPYSFDAERWRDDYTLTFTKLDTAGKVWWVRDPRGNLVMQFITPVKATGLPADPMQQSAAEQMPAKAAPGYDLAGNQLFEHSMDSGDRWMLSDGAGKPMFTWDFNDRVDDAGTSRSERRILFTRYDGMQRPIEQWLGINGRAPFLTDAIEYANTGGLIAAALASLQNLNLMGQQVRHWDPGGLATIERVDFKGAIEELTRSLLSDITVPVVDWNVADRSALLEADVFRQIAQHDALGRVTTLCNWHRNNGGAGKSTRVAVFVPTYNARGVLDSEILYTRVTKTTDASGQPVLTWSADTSKSVQAIRGITYNARGQRLSLRLGNGTTTRYSYDSTTLRLTRLYTRRDARFATDCIGNPDSADPPRPCGVQNLRYTYDPVGNVTHVQDDAQQTIWFNNQQVEPTNDFAYDALYRLTEAVGRENSTLGARPTFPDGPWSRGPIPSADSVRTYTEKYTYDTAGNLLTMQHLADVPAGQPPASWTRSYKPNADSNLLGRTWFGTNVGQAITYRYDLHGNIRNLDQTAPGLDVRWDWRDMIRALDLMGGGDAYYSYGIDKQRTRKRLVRNGGVVEDRIYLSGYELYRRTTSASRQPVEEIESHHLTDGQQRVLLVDDVITAASPANVRPDGFVVNAQTFWRYQYGNHLGSVSTEIDDAGRIISYEEYHPYGTTAYRAANSAIKAAPKRYRYTGLERDDESGLCYHGVRSYAPWLARWTSCDPAGIADDLNQCTYCRGSPLISTDRTGQGTDEEAFNFSARLVEPDPDAFRLSADTAGPLLLPDAPSEHKAGLPKYLREAAWFDPGQARLTAAKRAAAQGLDPATGRPVPKPMANWRVSNSEAAVAGGALSASLGLLLILSGPPGWMVGLTAALLFGTGVTAVGVGTGSLILEETHAITPEQSDKIGGAALLELKLGSPGGLVGANLGVLVDPSIEGFERGADIGNFAESGAHLATGVWSVYRAESTFSSLYSGKGYGWGSVRKANQAALGIGDRADRIILDPMTGRQVSLELSHWFSQRSTAAQRSLFNRPWNLRVMAPWEHARIDPFRNTGYFVNKAGPIESFLGSSPLWTHQVAASAATYWLSDIRDSQ